MQQDRAGFALSAAVGFALNSRASSRAGSLPHWIAVGHKICFLHRSTVGASLLAMTFYQALDGLN
ncbi:hypothetical protein DOZ80_14825 [Pseudomonas fluorescens]|uniref:Uncharacterized protein n=1 Tax=Pseudomonas fluorescens TaxID=294 RepID=A0A327N4V6_PSEFL|nr:hypothetical protein DOZ80_14825 [Pseudomonas fluorescens]